MLTISSLICTIGIKRIEGVARHLALSISQMEENAPSDDNMYNNRD